MVYLSGSPVLVAAMAGALALSGAVSSAMADSGQTAAVDPLETGSMVLSIEEATAWLHVKSFEMIRGCRRSMADGSAAFPPQVGSGYEAFWLRDYAYMLEGNVQAFTHKELRDACRLFVRSQRADGAMVDTVKFDSTPIYMPGMGSMGENPVADGSQFAVCVAWHTFQRTRDEALVREIVPALVRGMQAVPLNPATGLVHIRPEGHDRCPYGFTDTVRKQGDELFCSLLYVQASRQLADLFDALGDKQAQLWRDGANRTTESIRRVFWDGTVGLFRAATLKCREHDIWGSAFAVKLGVADERQAGRVAEYFRDHYGELVKRGQIRHTPGGQYWEEACPRDTYQNGAYWATPVGWFVYTLDRVDPRLADRTAIDLVNDFIAHGDVNECINDGYANVPNYVVSATLPLEGIRAMLTRRAAGLQAQPDHRKCAADPWGGHGVDDAEERMMDGSASAASSFIFSPPHSPGQAIPE